jgi:large subunit ribosomal protein L13
MTKIIVDAEGAVFGRLCSFAAKNALEGNEIIILNSEKAVITGRKNSIVDEFARIKKMGGTALKGPFYSRIEYKMLKRGVRGMLPNYRWGVGKQALARVMCYNGVPKEFEKEKAIKVHKARNPRNIEIKELARRI